MQITILIEATPSGIVGALALASPELDETFFLLNGDSLFNFNWLSPEEGESDDASWLVRMTLAHGIEGGHYGRVKIAGDRVKSLRRLAGRENAHERIHH